MHVRRCRSDGQNVDVVDAAADERRGSHQIAAIKELR